MSKNEMSAAAESAAEGAIAWLEQIAGDWRQLDTRFPLTGASVCTGEHQFSI